MVRDLWSFVCFLPTYLLLHFELLYGIYKKSHTTIQSVYVFSVSNIFSVPVFVCDGTISAIIKYSHPIVVI